MRKFKIFITIFLLYEFVILTVLQVPGYCSSVFNASFCGFGHFKYFLFGVMIPVMVGLLLWWTPDMTGVICKSCNKCGNNDKDKDTPKNIISEFLPRKDFERFVVAALILGLEKFVANHPKIKEVFNNISNTAKKLDKTK